MAIIYKTMKTFTRPDGDDIVQYEIVDENGRKMIAPNWYEHEDDAFTTGQHIEKDGVLYRFLAPHTAETAWNSNEVTAVDVGEEIEAIVTDLNQKASKVSGATNGNFAALDGNGNLTDSGKKPSDFLTEHQDISGKADKDTDAVEGNFAAFDSNGNPIDSGHKHSDYLTSHQDISGKADKVTGGTADNLAALDASGNLKDSGTSATELKSVIDRKADLIRDTVQNVAIAFVPDAANNLPLTALRFAVEPIQAGSGDPYPAGGGKNKLKPITPGSGTISSVDYTVYDDGTIKINGTATGAHFNLYFCGSSSDYADLGIPSGEYKMNGIPSGSACIITLIDNNGNQQQVGAGNDKAITVDDTKTYRLYLRLPMGSTATNEIIKPMIRLSTVADSTFAPYENKRPITGRTGAVVSQSNVNLFEDSLTGKGINASGKITNSATNNLYLGQVIAGVTYTFSTGGGTFAYAFYTAKPQDEDVSYNGERTTTNTTFTAPINGWIAVRLASDYASPMLVVGSTVPTEYTAHTGTQHTVQFGSTVFGGEVDWVGAECADGAEYVTFDGSETWRDNSGNGYFTIINNRFDLDKMPVFDYVKALERGGGATLGTWQGRLNQASTNKALLVKPDMTVYDTKEKWAEYLTQHPLHAVLWLVTPTTIPLSVDEIKTGTAGQFNLWSDSGDIVEMEYPCDTKGYIDKKLAALTALVLET